MAKIPLMPKATAVWLVDNTALTFEQIAAFCGLHVLEVKGIADGDVATGIKGMDPVSNGQLTREEIERAQKDPSYRLALAEPKIDMPEVQRRQGPRYTPVSRRQDRPDAIAWLLRYHPELTDAQIIKLVGTTKPTIQAIRDRTHWNSPNITPKDPVTLGLCSQGELDAAVQKAAEKVRREQEKARREAEKAGTLLPTEETQAGTPAPELDELTPPAEETPATAESLFPNAQPPAPADEEEEPAYDVESVFGNTPASEEESGEASGEDDEEKR
ncbi:DUF1013 domain-containing protein [Kaustia mangrovi]|uniref:DUF1013 domain-containing protein n=1 Tax=Kaustia mangrovi TaxID=2593653 RepID=A0A7S8HCX9_9HYPH|nr:cell cycle transcriptional regulator TrcR [Kaustia mangrovi]QPC43919.1 DUF1013 domain-containing protein [Kaustia mangrovi]